MITYPNSPYELHQPFPPAGDQPEAITKLIEGLEDGLSFQTLLGVTGSGKTFTMANVIARTGRPVRAITLAIVNVLPDPVTPRSVWNESPSSRPSISFVIASGWSPAGGNGWCSS